MRTNGESGWEWQPVNPALPEHRLTSAVTVQIPVGRDQAYWSDLPAVADAIIGGWQYTTAVRLYSGRPIFFNTLQVSGNPKLDNPTRDLWFDTTKFAAQPAFTPRTNALMIDSPRGWYQFSSALRSPRYRCSRAPMSRFNSRRPRISATVPVA